MAFTKSPEQDTYSTVEFPIVREMNSRDYNSTKDLILQNVIATNLTNKITQEHTLAVTKRAGYTVFNSGSSYIKLHYSPPTIGGTSVIYACSNAGVVYSFDMTNSGTFGTRTSIFTFTAGSSVSNIKFSDFKYDNGTQSVMVSDGTELWEITGGSATKVTDAQFPASHAAQSLCCMDGYVFVATALGDIYNSDLNNPQSWTAGNFIATEMSNDQVWVIEKLSNYLVVMGPTSTEFFYNAGVATGSPLQRNTSLYKAIGLVSESVANFGGTLYFAGIATPLGGSAGIYALTVDSLKKISNDAIDQKLLLRHHGTGSGQSNWRQKICLNAFPDVTTGNTQLSVVFRGTSTAGGAAYSDSGFYWINLDNGTSSLSTLDIMHSITTINTASVYVFFVTGIFRTTSSGSTINYFDASLSQDNGSNFTFLIQTVLEDFGTINQKSMNRLVLVGEKPTSTAAVSVSWTDDDYQNFSTAVSVDMFQELPSITRLGRFRRRALKIEGTHALPFSLERIEVDINKGNV